MKDRIVKINNNERSEYSLFDRYNLVEGITKSGARIPQGGVKLPNNVLGGYIQKGGQLKWLTVGKMIDDYSIPSVDRKVQSGGSKETEKNEINLKKAVELLRDYYQTNFN